MNEKAVNGCPIGNGADERYLVERTVYGYIFTGCDISRDITSLQSTS